MNGNFLCPGRIHFDFCSLRTGVGLLIGLQTTAVSDLGRGIVSNHHLPLSGCSVKGTGKKHSTIETSLKQRSGLEGSTLF